IVSADRPSSFASSPNLTTSASNTTVKKSLPLSSSNPKQKTSRCSTDNSLNACHKLRSNACSSTRELLVKVLSHPDFAVWKIEAETVSGFALWRDPSKLMSSEKAVADFD